MKSTTLGVVVGRFQVPDLSPGHRYLIESALALHEHVLVVLGETPARLTQVAPMPYHMRALMIVNAYPNVSVTSITDQPTDERWSAELDHVLSTYSKSPILYGGRDSFIPHYKGAHRVILVPPVESPDGTTIRRAVRPKSTADFRSGVVWATQHRYPVSYQCVDIACIDVKASAVLLVAKKKNDDAFRLPGGFVDPKDPSLEYAAQREFREETGCEPGTPHYIGSFRIEDYRYRKAEDNILTAVFAVPRVFGAMPKAQDDIDSVAWLGLIPANRDRMLPSYQPIFDAILAYAKEQDA